VMSLCKNDMVRRPDGKGGYEYFRVQTFSTADHPDLTLQLHTESNPAAEGLRKQRGALGRETTFWEKVNVTVLGEVAPAND